MKSEDEIIDEFLRAEDIHHRGSVDYQELVNRENATSSRIPSKKLVFLWSFIAAACLILTFLFQKQCIQKSEYQLFFKIPSVILKDFWGSRRPFGK